MTRRGRCSRLVRPLGLFSALAFAALAFAASAGQPGPDAATPGAAPARADKPPRTKVGLFLQPPFAMRGDDGKAGGMAVELWEEVAKELGLFSEYRWYATVRELLEAVEAGEIEVGVGDISVTHDRAKRFAFSFPWFDGGMRIMRRADLEPSFWSEVLRMRHYRVYGLFLLILLAWALVILWLHRRRDPGFPQDNLTGFTRALLEATSSVRCGEINQTYLGWTGHLLSVAWMLCGVGMVAYVTSTMTTAMTRANIDMEGIYELGDLPGRRVGVLRDGVAMAYLREMRVTEVPCADLADATKRLMSGKIDAMVTDAPALEYWVGKGGGKGRGLKVVGELFHPDKYAFLAGTGEARFMDRVSAELIRLDESGVIAGLKKKYFQAADE